MVAQFIPNNLQIDKAAAILHLETLGYSRGDKVCIRYINPSTKIAIKVEALDFEQMETSQRQGFNAYPVVNPGGHSDNDITEGRVIFYEHDNIDKSIQAIFWQSLGLPEPSLQVDTGGKSVHSYWVLSEPIDVPTWKKLQSDLLDFSNADRSIKNPSRVMRLAGSLYINKSGEAVGVAQIIRNSGKKYTLEELRRIIPEKSAVSSQQLPITNYQSPITNQQLPDIPLYQCLSKADRDLIDNGIGEGGRNVSGAKLARNLIGTANRLQHLGHRFEGDPRQIFDDYCSHCSPPLDTTEADIIWKSANKNNPTATLTDDALENCIKAWRKNQGVKEGTACSSTSSLRDAPQLRSHIGIESPLDSAQYQEQSSQSPIKNNVVLHPVVEHKKIDFDAIKKEFIALLNKGVEESDIELFKIKTREQYPLLQPSELQKLLNSLQKEFHKNEASENEADELEQIVKIADQTINLSDYLPEPLATALSQYCQSQNIRHGVILTSLLTGISSLHKVGTELIIHKNNDFTVPPTLYSAIVAESGSKKSPIFKATAKKPLMAIKQKILKKYQEELQQYQQELQQWEQKNKQGDNTEPKPTEPKKPAVMYFSEGTGEGIKAQAQTDPTKTLFLLCDELAGYFGNLNRYSGGKGSDKQDVLSFYDGDGPVVLRANGVKVDVLKLYLSILGTIQPDVLKKLMGDGKDSDGSWSRFLFAIQPNLPSTLPDDVPQRVDFSSLITDYFERIFEDLPVMTYTLSREAFKVYQKFYDRTEQIKVSHANPALRYVYSKSEGQVGRLAINLHVISEIASGRLPSNEIGVETIQKAIALMKFYIGQVKLIHSQLDDSETTAPHIFKLIELSKRKQTCGEEGWIKASDIQQNTTKSKRPSPVEARKWMIQAVDLGYGEIKGEASKISFRSFSTKKIDDTRQKIDNSSIDESIVIQDFGEKIDKIDKIDDFQIFTTTNDHNWGNTPKIDNFPNEHPPMDKQEIDNNCPFVYFVYSESETIDNSGVETIDNFLDTPSIFSEGQNIATGEAAIDSKYQVGDSVFCYPTEQFPMDKQEIDNNFPFVYSVYPEVETIDNSGFETIDNSLDKSSIFSEGQNIATTEVPTVPNDSQYQVGDSEALLLADRIFCYPTEQSPMDKQEIDNPLDKPSIFSEEQNIATTEVPTVSTDSKYQVGDRIFCYPTERHADNNWETKSIITSINYIKGANGQDFFDGCEVEYFDRKYHKQTAVIAGGNPEWLLRKV
jgi:hypothetical protein